MAQLFLASVCVHISNVSLHMLIYRELCYTTVYICKCI